MSVPENEVIRKIEFDGIRLLYGKLKFLKPKPVKMRSAAPFIEMHFLLAGSRIMHFTENGMESSITAAHHNLYYIPDTEFNLQYTDDKTDNISFQIQFTEEYFRRFLSHGNTVFTAFIKQIDNKKLAILAEENLKITNVMYDVLHNIVYCEKNGITRQLYIETNILKLLQLQLEQYEEGFEKKESGYVKDYDMPKFEIVRNLLETDITRNHTLAELCRKSGLNDFKLKKGFKELFGTTVFGYLHELRMETARDKLQLTNIPITEISEKCGYAYIQSFSSAFKKRYGISPDKIRKHSKDHHQSGYNK